MKIFTKMIINGDAVDVYCSDEGKEDVLFSVDMSKHYFLKGNDLKHNVFSGELDSLLQDEDIKQEELEEISDNINDEFMEKFCCYVPIQIYLLLVSKEINIDYPKEFSDALEYLSVVFQEAIKTALGLDENWNKIK